MHRFQKTPPPEEIDEEDQDVINGMRMMGYAFAFLAVVLVSLGLVMIYGARIIGIGQ